MKILISNLLGLLTNLFLWVISLALIVFTSWMGLLWAIVRTGSFKNLSKYFLNYAIMVDRTGNLGMSYMFNDILIKKNGYKFGQKDETISGVLGKNYRQHTLRFMGEKIAGGLDKIEPNHVEKAIKDNPQDI